ncbi:MAG: response regulator [Deltaproteobacteria bacterium]|nr:response regulator [Deltaproteobacteria bacterium]
MQSYITDTVFKFFEWTEGSFDFEIADTPDKVYERGTEGYLSTPLNPQYIVIEGTRKIDENKMVPGAGREHREEPNVLIKELEEIIVVDQDADSQGFLRESLESRGFKTAAIADLNTLYGYIKTIQDSPRLPLIVANLTIPKTKGEGMLGGMELLQWASDEKIKIPIVLLSSINNEEALKESRAMGVYAYLKRPKRFSRVSPDIDTYMDILEKVTMLCRQYQEAGFTFKTGTKEVVEGHREEDNAGYRFVQDITEEITREFQNEVELLPETMEKRPDTSPGLLTLKSMIDELTNPGFAGEVTLLIMRFASELLNRGILFLVVKNRLKGLGQFGLEAFLKSPNTAVKKMVIDVDEHSLMGRLINGRAPVKGAPERNDSNRRFFDQIGGEWPVESYAIPLLTADRVAAVFYGDNVPFKRKIPDMIAFEIFMSQASIFMEKAYLERILRERKEEQ